LPGLIDGASIHTRSSSAVLGTSDETIGQVQRIDLDRLDVVGQQEGQRPAM
jgi:hypothetical protein